jgi:hypothetical protein
MAGAAFVLPQPTAKATDTNVFSAPALLTQAAVDARLTWNYAPERLNGETVATHIKVSINFSLH